MNTPSIYPQFMPMGDQCVLVRFGDKVSESINHCAITYAQQVSELNIPGVIETVPSYTEAAVYYNALVTCYEQVLERLQSIYVAVGERSDEGRKIIRIPVCYGGGFGPDISHVARHNGLTEDEVIRIHTSSIYPVYMLGFTPGFCYLGNLPAQIACPRKSSPRKLIPSGSVGIGGEQTGVYPLETPGGWQLIGRTPVKFFDPNRQPNALASAGDSIQFYAISDQEFMSLISDGGSRG